jgi:hypothetical protein
MNKIIIAFFVVLAVFSCKKETENPASKVMTVTDYPYYLLSAFNGDTVVSNGSYSESFYSDDLSLIHSSWFNKLTSDTVFFYKSYNFYYKIKKGNTNIDFSLSFLSDSLTKPTLSFNLQNLVDYLDTSHEYVDFRVIKRKTFSATDTIYDCYYFDPYNTNDFINFTFTKLPTKEDSKIIGYYEGKLHHVRSNFNFDGLDFEPPINNSDQVTVYGKFSSSMQSGKIAYL